MVAGEPLRVEKGGHSGLFPRKTKLERRHGEKPRRVLNGRTRSIGIRRLQNTRKRGTGSAVKCSFLEKLKRGGA